MACAGHRRLNARLKRGSTLYPLPRTGARRSARVLHSSRRGSMARSGRGGSRVYAPPDEGGLGSMLDGRRGLGTRVYAQTS